MNNRLNTDNNINNINNIYLLLLNKYKKNLPKNYNEKVKAIGDIKRTEEYQQLSPEEQFNLFIELQSYKGG